MISDFSKFRRVPACLLKLLKLNLNYKNILILKKIKFRHFRVHNPLNTVCYTKSGGGTCITQATNHSLTYVSTKKIAT